MKKVLTMFIMICLVTFSALTVANAEVWNKCKVCHNGNMAPDEKTLKDKYHSASTFIKAAKESLNPMMKNYQGDEELKEAAKDLSLK
jgi:hypothetical protein